jgi:hypothetical protein
MNKPKLSKNTKNELRKLAATFFNTIGAGCVLLGLIGPMVTGRLVPTWETIPYELGAWGGPPYFILLLAFNCGS